MGIFSCAFGHCLGFQQDREQALTRAVVSRQGANFAHQHTLAHFLEPEGGSNVIQIGFFSANQMTANLTHRLNQEISITLLARATVEVLQLGMQIGETRCQVHAKPLQDGKVGHVDAVHVAGDRGRLDVRGVVVADVKHPVALMLVSTQHLGLQRHMVGQQGIGDNATVLTKILA
nr:hypothetical protein [Candidatus Nitrotoga arctica]